ncbi:MAG: hypothetical protein Q8S21_02750 [Candidatus Paracaedibacteraceae bacterium]|nr:hypothetical protein [Candidatus Paracaedibacteraceae bacterium]
MKIPNLSLLLRIRVQISIFLLGYFCIILKASLWGSLAGPRLFLWPFCLFYVSVFTTPMMSMIQVLILGLIHDSIFNVPLGLSSLLWIAWHGFLAKQRRSLLKAPISVLWGTFAGTYFVISTIEHLILLKTNYSTNIVQTFIETSFHIGLFPIALYYFSNIFVRLGRFS